MSQKGTRQQSRPEINCNQVCGKPNNALVTVRRAAFVADLHLAVWARLRRYSPLPSTTPPCATRTHILRGLWLWHARSGHLHLCTCSSLFISSIGCSPCPRLRHYQILTGCARVLCKAAVASTSPTIVNIHVDARRVDRC